MLTENTVTKLQEMHLSAMAKAFKDQMTDPNMADMSFEDRFGLIVDHEWTTRKNNHLNRLIKSAGFAEPNACVEDIEYHADTITFEQNYNGVDGDSASSTELYAIISSISEIPIKQYIAVTGSVSQKGEIQPIGGINEKIEGFFDVCKIKGFTGNQGVMMPIQNVKNLILKDEVIDAVKEGKFNIYAIKSIEPFLSRVNHA